MAAAGRHDQVEPLTRRTRAGKPYERPQAVETQIRAALALDRATLIARARTSDRASVDYLKEECLAYLVRDAFRLGDNERFSALMSILFGRCVRWLRTGLSKEGVDERDLDTLTTELFDTIIASLTAQDDRGDFFQVRFWRVLKKDLLNTAARYRRERRHLSLSDPIDGAGESDDPSALVRADIIPSREDVAQTVENRLDMAQALASVQDPRHRKAWILYHLEEWPIEAKDPADPSISRLFGVSVKTVHNWLRQATAELKAWYETHKA